jgi:hypothetical protein
LFAAYALALFFIGYYKIGLVSDDYLNFFDATHTTLQEKFTGKLPFTNTFHLRPIYYLSIEKSHIMSSWLGLNYDNFIVYRVQNLLLLILISFIAGKILLLLSGRFTLALIASGSVIIFPSNLNNICWTAARVDLLCGLFYISAIFFTMRFIDKKDLLSLILIYLSFIAALLTKETSITIPLTLIMIIYFIYGKETIFKYKIHFISLLILLLFYLLFRFYYIGNNISDISTLYQSNFLGNAPGVIARAIIGLTIPLDFLTLSRMLRQDNKIVLLYLASLYGAVFYLIWVMIKVDVYKHIAQIIALGFILITPYIFVGYIRPQMVFIPFVIILIFTLWVYNHHRQFNVSLNKNIFKAFYIVVITFWIWWSYVVIIDWEISYAKALLNVNNLINTGLEQSKQNVIIGNPGRYKQTFLFDKLTGAYNFWKEKSFTIKDTIDDVVQTGALDESSIGSKLEIRSLDSNEYEIKATGKTQFFYIEGYNLEKIKTGYRNHNISVEFTEFNYLDKPIRLKFSILSKNVNCYLVSELKFFKIF